MKLDNLNFHHLRYFWMVATLGSMTAAANRLGLRTQTLSSQISDLEQSLGRSLFRPQGRGLALTEAGRVALRYADQIFQLGDQLQDSLQDPDLDHALRLTVGIADALPKAVCYRLLQPVMNMARPVRLICQEGRFEWLSSELAQHRIDLVLAERAGGQGTSQLHYQELASIAVRVFATPELAGQYEQDFPASLDKAPFLMPSRNNMLRARLEQWLEDLNVEVRVVGEFDDLALMETFGRKGMGLFALPAADVEDIATGGSLRCLGVAQGVEERCFAFVHPRSLDHPALALLLNAGKGA